MDLRGAKIRSFYEITADVETDINSDYQVRVMKVPHYQRPYKWSDEQITKLVEDWRVVGDNKYFCGSVVTAVTGLDKFSEHQVIDGQQRFTTLFLANFICYMLCRINIRLAIDTKRPVDFYKICEGYGYSEKFLLHYGNQSNSLKSLSDYLTNKYEDCVDSEGSYQLYKDAILEMLALPTDKTEDDEEYLHEHYELFSNWFCSVDNSLFLAYDRSSFNDDVRHVLSSVCIYLSEQKQPELTFYNADCFTEIQQQYKNALVCLFELFKVAATEQLEAERGKIKPFNFSLKMVSLITSFLNNIKLCVIQTGSVDDAYVLFEVLNDRALALDDLDLVKNQIYKSYVLSNQAKNKPESPAKVDKVIQFFDEEWVEKLFKGNVIWRNKLVAYLATVFITGDSSLQHDESNGYRKSLQKHLSVLEQRGLFNENEIKKYLNIFKACRALVETFGLGFKKRDADALEKEWDRNASSLMKTIHLTYALKYEGVLAGLVSFILKYISLKDGCQDFAPDRVQDELTKLSTSAVGQSADVSLQANQLWKLVIMSKDYKASREFSRTLIENNSLLKSGYQLNQIYANDVAYLKDEFQSYLRSWSYGANPFRLRVLFARLLSYGVSEEGTLKSQVVQYTLPIEQIKLLELDHLEPRNINESCRDKYFSGFNRDKLVNGIGNMMPLPKNLNIKKSDKPLAESKGFYAQFGIEQHGVFHKTFDLYEKHMDSHGAPTAAFFSERENWLIELFTSMLLKDCN